jgi:hypothetical protein
MQRTKEREVAILERKKIMDQETAFKRVHTLDRREQHRLFMIEQRTRDEEGAVSIAETCACNREHILDFFDQN